jgi:hypothetical protein
MNTENKEYVENLTDFELSKVLEPEQANSLLKTILNDVEWNVVNLSVTYANRKWIAVKEKMVINIILHDDLLVIIFPKTEQILNAITESKFGGNYKVYPNGYNLSVNKVNIELILKLCKM